MDIAKQTGLPQSESQDQSERQVLRPTVRLQQIEFCDGTRVNLSPGQTLVIVGPNNCGKSETLRGIVAKLGDVNQANSVITAVHFEKLGTFEEIMASLGDDLRTTDHNGTKYITGFGQTFQPSQAKSIWNYSGGLSGLSGWFAAHLSAEGRLALANPAESIRLTREGAKHPIHFLQKNSEMEEVLSKRFRQAFGTDLIVHRNAGADVPLLVGTRPVVEQGEDRLSLSYQKKLDALPLLQSQGDGMRSFAGVLLSTATGKYSIVLIDEPEAFLHPPQARILGAAVLQRRVAEQQVVLATHSGDLLRGLLNVHGQKLSVVRLARNENGTTAKVLDAGRIKTLWSDPLLRYSNILDGLFHDGVIVCESDGDCRFFGAVLDAILEKDESAKRPDLLFTHCGGKDRLHTVILALRDVGVPVRAVADFDVLSNDVAVKRIIEAFGGSWDDFQADWKVVHGAIASRRPTMEKQDVENNFQKVIEAVPGAIVDEASLKKLQEIVKRASPWALAKEQGIHFVPAGDQFRTAERLISNLERLGLYVLRIGELERFDLTEGNHGPKWVNKVITKDLANDLDFAAAREFVSKLCGLK